MSAGGRQSWSERGAGSILAIAVLGATVLLTTLVVSTLTLLAVGRSVANAADAAALAAADTASGAIAGYPCPAANAVAALNEVAVTRCAVAGLIASVSVTRTVLGIELSASARAGPPPEFALPETAPPKTQPTGGDTA
jgi:secretion/DNA translocation related TadE-like protein